MLLPLNFSPSADPLQPDIPVNPGHLAVAYDAVQSEYLFHFRDPAFLTPDWDRSIPSWQQFYVWRFDAKTDAVQRVLLPPGPWVADAKLDGIELRAVRNFSCGIDCYRHADIRVNGDNVYVTVTGRASAISESVMGTYRLRLGEKEWLKQPSTSASH